MELIFEELSCASNIFKKRIIIIGYEKIRTLKYYLIFSQIISLEIHIFNREDINEISELIKSSLIIVFNFKDYSIINQIIEIKKANAGPIIMDINEVMFYDIENDLLIEIPSKDMEMEEQKVRTILKYQNHNKLFEAILIYLYENNYNNTFDWKLLEINILFNKLFNNKINKINFIDNINNILDDLIIPDDLNIKNEKDILSGMYDLYRDKNSINKILNLDVLYSILQNMDKKSKNNFLFICNMNIIILNGIKNKIKDETKKDYLSINKIDKLNIKKEEIKSMNKLYEKKEIYLPKLNCKIKKIKKVIN